MKPNYSVSKNEAEAVRGYVPGAFENAARKEYFDRGSASVIANQKTVAAVIFLGVLVILQAISIAVMLPLKSVEVVQVYRSADGQLVTNTKPESTANVDDSTRMAWINDWATLLTEINAATWQRNVAIAVSRTAKVANDQAQDYLRQADNQPAQILRDSPDFVREFKRSSVNKLQDNVFLIRYTLTTRQAAGAPKIVKAYAMTVTLGNSKAKTKEDVQDNPSGLAVQSFNISEEISK